MHPTSIHLGGREFSIDRLPFARLRLAISTINRIGAAAAKNVFDDAATADLSALLCIGLNIDPAELDELPTTLGEVERAIDAIVKITGYEEAVQKAMEQGRQSLKAVPVVLAQEA